jgi:cytoskeletal protein CcmA (bactofilin family)
MFTTKPESGESMTKLVEGVADTQKPLPEIFAPKSPRLSGSKMVPSIIGEDLTITGNVTSKGEVQVDGEIQGDIHCSSLLIGEKSHVRGEIVAEEVVVRGRVVGSIKGLRITLQAPSHVEGDIYHQSVAIEQGAYFEGKSRRSDNPMAEMKAPSTNGSASFGSHSAERSPSMNPPSLLPPVAAE